MILCSIMNWQPNLTMLLKRANIIDYSFKKPEVLLYEGMLTFGNPCIKWFALLFPRFLSHTWNL